MLPTKEFLPASVLMSCISSQTITKQEKKGGKQPNSMGENIAPHKR